MKYCISRNADEIFGSTKSDVDLVVQPEAMADIEKLLDIEAQLHGYRQIARIEFTNLCLVYWAPGSELVRIDLDGELRWYCFEIADALTLLEGAAERDGVAVISLRSEWFVMADRLAWQGSLPPRYKNRVAQLLQEEEKLPDPQGSNFRKFLNREDSRGLRRYLIFRTLFSPRMNIRAVCHGWHDFGRVIRRFLSPPGVFLRVTGAGDMVDWNELFGKMSMAFPEAKCVRLGASPLRGLIGLFRGGLVVADRDHPFAACLCELFSSRRRRFRVASTSHADHSDLIIPPSSDRAAAFADVLAAAILAKR
ncbi:MAG: hypothetical protein ACKO2G_16510 [Verrucomicrobiales bacterium]